MDEEFEEFKCEILQVANTTSVIIERYAIMLYGNWVVNSNFDSAVEHLEMMREAMHRTINKTMELLFCNICYIAGVTTDPGDQTIESHMTHHYQPTNQLIDLYTTMAQMQPSIYFQMQPMDLTGLTMAQTQHFQTQPMDLTMAQPIIDHQVQTQQQPMAQPIIEQTIDQIFEGQTMTQL